jgi:hypothetical protein
VARRGSADRRTSVTPAYAGHCTTFATVAALARATATCVTLAFGGAGGR